MGGLIVVLAVAWTISLFAFRRMPPHRRAIFTAGSAWLVCAAIWGFFLPSGFYGGLIGFSIGAAVVGVERYIHYSKHWTDEPGTGDEAEIFR
ncbi:hypothetical protein [Sphingopyxis alaskensis]|jgi:hypothetical protein|nr:hypothetical protein [Sphingopyxis alaskensis]MCM3420364.1 hypothetical protein [Sphingopyxis alaskensis]